MDNRLTTRFAELKAQGRCGLVTFIMGGDPDQAQSAELLARLPEAGADVIELGMPFSDPMADGKSIQNAGIRALESGATLASTLALARGFRAKNTTTPLVLMGYLNPVERYGYEAFARDAAEAGVDGIILVDLPPEEDADTRALLSEHNIAMVRLIAPTTVGPRLPEVLAHAAGFVYAIAVAGITGEKSAVTETLAAQIATIRQHTNLPVAAGFGIRTPDQAREIAQGTKPDAIVVGSAVVDALAKDGMDGAVALVSALKAALNGR